MRILILLLLGSCAFLEGAAKPASVAAAGAAGAVVAGPAGAAAAGGGVSAAWDISDAEKGQVKAEDRLDALTLAAITGETGPLKAQLANESGKVERIIFWLFVALVAYIFKQPLWSYLTRRRIRKETTK